MAVAVLVIHQNEILLVQRANTPYRGLWSLPAGFMDPYEKPENAAARECKEETGMNVEIIKFLELISGREHVEGADILLVYQAQLNGGKLQAGDDARQAAFFQTNQMPPLAFKTTHQIIENHFMTLPQKGN